MDIEFNDVLAALGEAGARVCQIDASEGSAGNLSVYMGWEIVPGDRFPVVERITLPAAVPEMAGGWVVITGSGRRLREISKSPESNLGCVKIEEGGQTGLLYTSPKKLFTRLTTEFNSHLMVHHDQVHLNGVRFHSVVHAQPMHLTYLTHIPRYQDWLYLNQHVMRWEPEAIIQFPDGIGYVPFCVPGSKEMMEGNIQALRKHSIAVWAKHGVMSRSNVSPKQATDKIEYAETGARYEYMNLAAGEQSQGLSVAEIKQICQAFNIQQQIFA